MRIRKQFLFASTTDPTIDPWLDEIFAYAEKQGEEGVTLRVRRRKVNRTVRYIVTNHRMQSRTVLQKSMGNVMIKYEQRMLLRTDSTEVIPGYMLVEESVWPLDPLGRLAVARYLAEVMARRTTYSEGNYVRLTVGIHERADRFGGVVTAIEEDGQVVTATLEGMCDVQLDPAKVTDTFLCEGNRIIYDQSRNHWERVDDVVFALFYEAYRDGCNSAPDRLQVSPCT